MIFLNHTFIIGVDLTHYNGNTRLQLRKRSGWSLLSFLPERLSGSGRKEMVTGHTCQLVIDCHISSPLLSRGLCFSMRVHGLEGMKVNWTKPSGCWLPWWSICFVPRPNLGVITSGFLYVYTRSLRRWAASLYRTSCPPARNSCSMCNKKPFNVTDFIPVNREETMSNDLV